MIRYEDHIYVSRDQNIYKFPLDGSKIDFYKTVDMGIISKLQVVTQNNKKEICAFTTTGFIHTWCDGGYQTTKLSNTPILAAEEFDGKLYIGSEDSSNINTNLQANSIVIHNQTLYYGGNDGKIYYF